MKTTYSIFCVTQRQYIASIRSHGGMYLNLEITYSPDRKKAVMYTNRKWALANLQRLVYQCPDHEYELVVYHDGVEYKRGIVEKYVAYHRDIAKLCLNCPYPRCKNVKTGCAEYREAVKKCSRSSKI